MTVQEVLTKALRLAGEADNQEEYLDTAIDAINSVQAKISKFAKVKTTFKELETESNLLTLPSDLFKLINVLDVNHNKVNYKRIGKKQIYLELDGTYTVVYAPILTNVKSTNLNATLETEDIANECLIYGVASIIAMENDVLYPILNDEYNNLLANLASIKDFEKDGVGLDTITTIDGMWF